MNTVGGIFGEITLICIVFLAMRLILKTILNLPGLQGKPIPEGVKKLFQFINKYHRLVGIVAVSTVIAHFVLQYSSLGYIPIAGLLAGLALLLQAGAGLLMRAQKDPVKRKRFVMAHTIWGVILVAAVLEHRLKIF